ncbi:hypothetical protein, partial [Enterobacter cloacae complex sp. CH23B]|uniref:hypothetical protein n=1 Tax=Enterobacter cloacae complex sp. CH23B TaxID=2511986 RepID=UPI001025FD81
RWTLQRNTCVEKCNRQIQQDNIIAIMLSSETNWMAVIGYIESVLREKKQEESVYYTSTPA